MRSGIIPIIYLIILMVSACASVLAHADDEPKFKVDLRKLVASNDQPEGATVQLKIAGKLTCNLGAQNTGEPCDLTLQDTKSGKTYKLVNNREVMSLYFDGKKEVEVRGTLADSQAINVASVKALQ